LFFVVSGSVGVTVVTAVSASLGVIEIVVRASEGVIDVVVVQLQ
jgi:hypothetical protein